MPDQDEKTKLECERGRIISERAKRQSDLSRYVEGKKVKVMVALAGHVKWEDRGRVNLFYVDDVFVGSQQEADDDYPCEALMATIALAVGATVGFEGIPSSTTIDVETRKRRDKYREQMASNLHWSQERDRW